MLEEQYSEGLYQQISLGEKNPSDMVRRPE